MIKEKYFKIVKKYIDESDPYYLLDEAPKDEYDGESKEIACRINNSMNLNEIDKIISNVFLESFNLEIPAEKCKEIAERIYEEITRNDR